MKVSVIMVGCDMIMGLNEGESRCEGVCEKREGGMSVWLMFGVRPILTLFQAVYGLIGMCSCDYTD